MQDDHGQDAAQVEGRVRALTLTQPWCGLVASGIKLIENRPRALVKRADFGKPFALHASREIDQRIYHRIAELAPELATVARNIDGHLDTFCSGEWFKLSCLTSAVIGIATIDRMVHLGKNENPLFARGGDIPVDQHRWLFGPVGYVLRDIRALPTAVPCRGWQGFWTLPDDIERAVTAQFAEAA